MVFIKFIGIGVGEYGFVGVLVFVGGWGGEMEVEVFGDCVGVF